jgi:uracil-DNA glycosylase family 4
MDQRAAHGDWFNGPVPPFGDISAQLLIVGLAPGLQGANKTGRPFTGDGAGDTLYPSLGKFGFARGTYQKHPDDGLELINCRITNAVRCVPPQNKPIGAEINNCRPFLLNEVAAMANLKVILCLGKISHDVVIRSFGGKLSAYKFAHAAQHQLATAPLILDSYHCSRYNTNTGRLTTAMFDDIIKTAKSLTAK